MNEIADALGTSVEGGMLARTVEPAAGEKAASSSAGHTQEAACRAWVQNAPGSMPAPDLLIVDYRLENGMTGADALALLRERFGADLPGIVITGSTMSSLDLEAQQKNFHLLIKPVVPNKLRAMIAFKLGVKTG